MRRFAGRSSRQAAAAAGALALPLARAATLRPGSTRSGVRLRHLLELDTELGRQLDKQAIAYDGGVHAKHRLMRYHDFFVERVRPGERVLDVGCGKGELALDLATRAGADVVGIDVNEDYLRFARERFRGVDFRRQDALAGLPEGHFDVVVLSNVLEHIAPRVELLRRLVAEAAPGRVLIRVPMSNRHWAVPLRSELGLDPYNDPTHETEYEPEELRRELAEAGLEVTDEVLVWGEIWAEARPV